MALTLALGCTETGGGEPEGSEGETQGTGQTDAGASDTGDDSRGLPLEYYVRGDFVSTDGSLESMEASAVYSEAVLGGVVLASCGGDSDGLVLGLSYPPSAVDVGVEQALDLTDAPYVILGWSLPEGGVHLTASGTGAVVFEEAGLGLGTIVSGHGSATLSVDPDDSDDLYGGVMNFEFRCLNEG